MQDVHMDVPNGESGRKDRPRPAGLVRARGAGAAVARAAGYAARPLQGVAERDHAAADHGQGGDAALSSTSCAAGPTWTRWRAPSWARCSRPGPGLAITPAPAICMLAPASCPMTHGGHFPDTEEGLRELPGIGGLYVRGYRRHRLRQARYPGRRQYRAGGRQAVRD